MNEGRKQRRKEWRRKEGLRGMEGRMDGWMNGRKEETNEGRKEGRKEGLLEETIRRDKKELSHHKYFFCSKLLL